MTNYGLPPHLAGTSARPRRGPLLFEAAAGRGVTGLLVSAEDDDAEAVGGRGLDPGPPGVRESRCREAFDHDRAPSNVRRSAAEHDFAGRTGLIDEKSAVT